MITLDTHRREKGVHCTECKKILNWETLSNAIKLYGLIVLVRKDAGYFGITCPKCIKTIIYETDRPFLEFLISGKIDTQEGFKVFSPKFNTSRIAKLAYTFMGNRHLYHNLLEGVIETVKCIPSFEHMMEISFGHLIEIDGDPDVPIIKKIYSNHLCSFLFPSYAYGPSLNLICPFADIHSEKIFRERVDWLEKKGFESFESPNFTEPPFGVPDDDDLSEFPGGDMDIPDGWDNENPEYYLGRYFQKPFFPELEHLKTASITNNEERNLINLIRERENSTGKKIFPRYILFDPFYLAADKYYVNYCDGRYNIITNEFNSFSLSIKPNCKMELDFLYLIDFPHYDEFSSIKYSNEKAERLTPGSSYIPISTELKIKLSNCGKISAEIWDKFSEEPFQYIFVEMSENFIDEYSDLKERIDCSFDLIWQLKDKYLYQLYEFIKSVSEREKIKKQVSKKTTQRIRVLEAPYPKVQAIISENSQVNRIKQLLIKSSQYYSPETTFLIRGERGTGKELFAKAIHEILNRNSPFIKVDCGTKIEGLFESKLFGRDKGAYTGADKSVNGAFAAASDGVVFLDEIGNLKPELQDTLLTPLQDREFQPLGTSTNQAIKAHVVAATNADLESMIENGKFRPDLYDRLSSIPINIPPLRKRIEDLPLLLNHFFSTLDPSIADNPKLKPLKVSTKCLKILEQYDWPGNVRELEHVVERIIPWRLGNEDRSDITPEDLDKKILKATRKLTALEAKDKKPRQFLGNQQYTDEEIINAMEQTGGNKTQAAKIVGCSPVTVWRRCENLPCQQRTH